MTESYSITFEVTVDREQLDDHVQIDWSEVAGSEMSGRATADLEAALEAVESISLTQTSAPEPIPHAIEWAILEQL